MQRVFDYRKEKKGRFLRMREKCKKLCTRLFEGEVTLRKTDFWIWMLIAALFGVLWGFLHAPLTHGVQISCGNNNGNMYGKPEEDEAAPQEAD